MGSITRRFTTVLAAWLLTLVVVCPLCAQQSVDTISISLEAGLQQLEERHGSAFLYEAQLLRGQRIPTAWLTETDRLENILDKISEATSLDFTAIEEGFWAVQPRHPYGQIRGYVYDQDGEPLIGASVFHPSSQRGTPTNLAGYYELWVPAGELSIQTSYIGFQTVDTLLWVPFGQKEELDFYLPSSIDLTEVVVLGSTPKSLSYLAPDSPAEQLRVEEETARLPLADLGQLLQYATPSFHSTYQTLSDGTDHVDPAALRGLGPDQLIVLINGQRRHTSALVNVNNTVGRGSVATDLNSIPLSAIERVEILPDGATAQYGSDAIAGVINIVLKEADAPSSVQLASGLTAAGDGFQIGASGHLGHHSERHNWRLSWRLDSRSAVNRAGNYTGAIFGDSRDQRADSVAAFFAQTGFADQRVMEVGSAAIQNFGFLFQHERKVVAEGEVYQFGGVNLRQGHSRGFYRFPYQTRKQSGLYHWGFSPEIHPQIFDASWLVGWRRKLGDWHVDFNQNIGGNQVSFIIENSNNASLGLQSPTTANAGSLLYGQLISKGDATRVSKNGRTAWHVGLQWRNELFKQTDGDEWSWKNYSYDGINPPHKEGGIQVFPGYRPTHRTRNWRSSLSAYVLLNHHFNDQWRYAVAVRSESWEEIGTFLTGKLAVSRIWPSGLRVQTVLNSGLRPPSLGQAYFSSQSLQFISAGDKLIGAEIAQLNSEHPLVTDLLGQPLQPERSFNYSLRLHWPIAENKTFSATAYRINIQDRIVLGSQLDGRDHSMLYDLLETNDLDKVQFFSNSIETATWGLDLGYEQQWSVGVNDELRLRLVGSINRTRLSGIKLPESLQGLEHIVFNRQDQARLEYAQPQSKAIAQLSWFHQQLSVNLQSTRFGRVTYRHPADEQSDNWIYNGYTGAVETRDQTFSPKWITDLALQWQVRKYLRYGLQIRNVFDVYPDEHQHSANTNDGTFRYSRYVQQFGVWGQHFLISCQFSW